MAWLLVVPVAALAYVLIVAFGALHRARPKWRVACRQCGAHSNQILALVARGLHTPGATRAARVHEAQNPGHRTYLIDEEIPHASS